MPNSRHFLLSVAFPVVALAILQACSIPAAGQTAGDELNKGVDAYKSARYSEAIAYFRKAAELDPTLPAKAYLGTALAQNVVPGLDTPDNLKTAQEAIDTFQQILAANPHDLNSLKQVAGVYYAIKKFDDAKAWQKKVLIENPSDPEAAYTIGVIDWTLAHENAREALSSVHMLDDGMGNAGAPGDVMQIIHTENSALVDEALQYLAQAIANRQDYDDAMAYLSLVYRRKADLDWGDEDARKEDLAKAEQWKNIAMESRRANREKRGSTPN